VFGHRCLRPGLILEEKAFFFEKKKQKTFGPLSRRSWEAPDRLQKFLAPFLKKDGFP
jgi:hypothetical protein